MLAGLAIAAVVGSLLMLAAPAIVTAVFFAPAFGIPETIVLLVAVGLATGGILQLFTGRRQIGAGVLASLAATAALIVLFIMTPRIPMNWIPALKADIGMLPAGPIAAAAAALALRRWWIRIGGAVVLLAAIAVPSVPAVIAGVEQRAAEAEQERQARESELAEMEMPVTTEWDGAHVRGASGGDWDAIADLVTSDGGALEIVVYDDPAETGRNEFACWLMDHLGSSFDETITMDRYTGICEANGPGAWRLVDGSAQAVVFEGRLVTIGSPPVESQIADIGAARPATAGEVAAAAARLHTMTRDEYVEFVSKLPSERRGL